MNLLEQHPRWIEHEKLVAEAREQRSKVTAAINEEQRQHQEAMAVHRAAVEAAVRDGSPIPQDEPQRSRSNAVALEYVQRQQEALYADGQRLQVELLPELEATARERWQERRDELVETVAVLTEAAKATRADAGVVARSRALADSQKAAVPRPHAGERTQTQWQVEDVVDAVRRDLDPFELEPVRRPRIEDGHGAPESTPPQRPISRHKPTGFVSL